MTPAPPGRISRLSVFTRDNRTDDVPQVDDVPRVDDVPQVDDAPRVDDVRQVDDVPRETGRSDEPPARRNLRWNRRGPGGPRGRVRRFASGLFTVLAFLLVLFALVAPNQIERVTPGALLRIPVEGLIAVAVLLVLPPRSRRVLAVLSGIVLGLLTILKIADMGFYSVLVRPVDPVLDWSYLSDGVEFLTSSMGRTGAIAVEVAVVIIALLLPVLMVASVLRVTRVALGHRRITARAVAGLGVAWALCAILGAQLVPGAPLASHSAATLAYDNVHRVRTGLRDQQAFANEVAVDAFRDTPGDQLLTGLRGKDVMLTFIESYGRSAVEDPALAPGVDAVLDAGTASLKKAGYSSRSAFLTSPTAGGGSWLAHSTFLSGLWINNQQRYNNLVTTDRLTLNGAFGRADWRTVGVMPAVTRAWPEGAFYGDDKIYASKDLGYHGPHFSWAPMPDQFALSAFQRFERSDPKHAPVMAEIPLVSSHAPWAPIPHMIDWNDVGDGSIYDPMPATGLKPGVIWRDAAQVRTEYGRSIQYSLSALISYVQKYGDKNLVLVFLGDHQPAPIVTGAGASRDVPITIVAKDPAVLDRIADWGWQDGLNPDPQAPVWPMNSFRDRFLTTFGPQPKN